MNNYNTVQQFNLSPNASLSISMSMMNNNTLTESINLETLTQVKEEIVNLESLAEEKEVIESDSVIAISHTVDDSMSMTIPNDSINVEEALETGQSPVQPLAPSPTPSATSMVENIQRLCLQNISPTSATDTMPEVKVSDSMNINKSNPSQSLSTVATKTFMNRRKADGMVGGTAVVKGNINSGSTMESNRFKFIPPTSSPVSTSVPSVPYSNDSSSYSQVSPTEQQCKGILSHQGSRSSILYPFP